jgi:hypothetical protein
LIAPVIRFSILNGSWSRFGTTNDVIETYWFCRFFSRVSIDHQSHRRRTLLVLFLLLSFTGVFVLRFVFIWCFVDEMRLL